MVPLTKHRSVQSAAPETSLAALRVLFGKAYVRDFGVWLWDGTRVPSEGSETFVFCVNAPGALRIALAKPTDLAAGRAFVGGLIDIEGDVESAVDALMRATSSLSPLRALRLMHLLRRLPEGELPELREVHLRGRLHSRGRDSAAIAFHYDLPVDFYRTFLGPHLMYSCAYFDDGVDAIDDAQDAKIDYVLRKVRLRPGERLLDIGCGWGSLIMRATSRFGARATGITLSKSQYEEARRRISEDGNAAEIHLRDYRELGDAKFDKIVSIGMFEHVGRRKLREYFNAAFRALRPGGLFLNQGIATQDPAYRSGKATDFISRFIFPDGELVRVSEALAAAEVAGFEVRDVENLREHYVRTLRAWVAKLERNRAIAVAAADEHAFRTWRLYMAASAQGFRVGRLGLFQVLLGLPDAGGRVTIPPTRRDLYA